jgi:hypothetical protein
MSILSFLFGKKKRKEQPFIKRHNKSYDNSNGGSGNDYYTDLNSPLNFTNPSYIADQQNDVPAVNYGGGSFSGAGACSSWEDSSSQSNDHGSYDSGSSYNSSDSSSYDSGSSSDSSSCDSSSSGSSD